MASQKEQNYANQFRMQIPSNPRYVSVARNFVYNLARQCNFSLHDSADLKLAVGECLLNVIKHAYLGKTNYPIFLEITALDDRMEIRIRDFGVQKNLSTIQSYDPGDYREEGIGLFLIRRLTDHFYIDQSGRGNKLILTKKK
ncbi:anti-anti-sigma factor [Leptospira perolatii]|uniref:Anti-anti-sigma factor n=1 Tax=Leptospira perolatii TaxID=2023191 RepID=A0A2M9ZMU7_9LEPT|nr:ATP-binding protein [Leptospira perolatii]PJZ70120.1 anti-anti-sigma factor [Leptospira perolatii]PJZ73309.1 anti-anti-sigma factor [Leptospira perolatii]